MMSVAMNTLSQAISANTAAITEKTAEIASSGTANLSEKLSTSEMQTYASLSADAGRMTELALSASTALPDFTAQSAALERFFDTTETLSSSLITSGTGDGAGLLDDLVSTMNTQVGDHYLFSGTSWGIAPVPDGDWVLDKARAAFDGASSTEEGIAAVRDFFLSEDGGYAEMVGRISPSISTIADDRLENVTLADATEPALRLGLAGAALSALADETGIEALATAGLETLTEANAEGIELRTRIGASEGRIETARDQYEARAETAEAGLRDIEDFDQAEATIDLLMLTQQAELLYSVTAKIASLTLTDYL